MNFYANIDKCIIREYWAEGFPKTCKIAYLDEKRGKR